MISFIAPNARRLKGVGQRSRKPRMEIKPSNAKTCRTIREEVRPLKRERCGNEYSSFLYSSFPYCGYANSVSLLKAIFGLKGKKRRHKSLFGLYDWGNPDICLDRECRGDEDRDGFDS